MEREGGMRRGGRTKSGGTLGEYLRLGGMVSSGSAIPRTGNNGLVWDSRRSRSTTKYRVIQWTSHIYV